MLFVPSAAEFTWIDSMGDGWQPNVESSMTLVTSAYGSYVSLIVGSLVTTDVVGFWLSAAGGGGSGQARDITLIIGLDPAGGTSFIDFIMDIIVSCCATYYQGRGSIWYWFPVRIPAGASIGVKGAVNNVAPGVCQARVVLACKPKSPEMCKMGSRVVTYGFVPANIAGTPITAGTTSEGAWTQVGTVAAGDSPWFWQVGLGINNAAMADTAIHVDLGIGDASNKRIVIPNQVVLTTSSEQVSATYTGGAGVAVPGDKIYVRAQQGTAQTGLSAIAYGVC